MDETIMPCPDCGHDALRVAKGIEMETYECANCSRTFMISWDPVGREAPQPLVLRAKVTRSRVYLKDRFELTFFLSNTTKGPITIMRPGDGSEMGWRPPKTNVIVHRRDGGKWESFDPYRTWGRCGVMNPLGDHDFVTIKPGEEIDVTGWFHLPRAERLGDHFIEAVYENDPAMRTRVGAPTPALTERMRSSFKCVVRSNTVRVEVVSR